MRLHTNQLAIRLLGTLTGVGFLVVGGYAILGADAGVAESLRERATWFGITALVGGVWAVGVSWLDSDLARIWCRSPRSKGQPTDS